MHLVLLIALGNSLYVSSMVTGISSVIDEDARKFLAAEGPPKQEPGRMQRVDSVTTHLDLPAMCAGHVTNPLKYQLL